MVTVSYGDARRDVRMRLVTLNIKIFVAVIKDRLRPPLYYQRR